MLHSTLLLPSDEPTLELLVKLTGLSTPDNHPDCVFIRPLEGKSSISIDQVHGIAGPLSFKPYSAQKKTFIFTFAHLLTLPAQQALLKTLEEPPIDTLMVLCTSLPAKLLPTIRSRTTLYSFLPEEKESSPASSPTSSWIEELERHPSISRRIALASSLATSKEQAISSLQELVSVSDTKNNSIPVADHLRRKQAAIRAIGYLEKNINVKLTLEDFFFQAVGPR